MAIAVSHNQMAFEIVILMVTSQHHPCHLHRFYRWWDPLPSPRLGFQRRKASARSLQWRLPVKKHGHILETKYSYGHLSVLSTKKPPFIECIIP